MSTLAPALLAHTTGLGVCRLDPPLVQSLAEWAAVMAFVKVINSLLTAIGPPVHILPAFRGLVVYHWIGALIARVSRVLCENALKVTHQHFAFGEPMSEVRKG